MPPTPIVHPRRKRQHGMRWSAEYEAWHGMISRCTNPKHISYHNYGGRGITICQEWRQDFLAFYEHVGPKPSTKHWIDRIDNNGNYEPGNVRWATPKEQMNNKSRTPVDPIVAAFLADLGK